MKEQIGLSLTRRQFGASSIAAVAALTGCSKDDGDTIVLEQTPQISPPQVEAVSYAGGAPHNCLVRCISRAYVQNGRIKRIETDERPDTQDQQQFRACIKCRSYKGRVHSPARLMYPLIYDKNGSSERGDMTKFRRATWDEAMDYIKAKYDKIKNDNPGALGIHFCTSGTSAANYQSNAQLDYVINRGMGGCLVGWGNPSFHAGQTVNPVVFGDETASAGAVGAFHYSPNNLLYSDNIILWGGNIMDSTGTVGLPWWMIQAKERGARILSINPVYNSTAEFADDFIPIIPGSDIALILAMMYEMIRNDWLEYDVIERLCVGFFDDPAGSKPVRSTYPAASTVVPEGRSLASYIMGAGFITPSGRVIKPSTWGQEYPGAAASAYRYKKEMDLPKSPEWAAPICGISAGKIRELAQLLSDRSMSTAIHSSVGIQRQPSGYAICWILGLLTLVTGQFGLPGTGLTYVVPAYDSSVAGTLDPAANLPVTNNPEFNTIYPLTHPDPALVGKPSPYFTGSICFSELVWRDIIRKSNGISPRWNDGDVAKLDGTKPVKIIYNIASNSMVNQHQDTFDAVELLKNRNTVELIITVDNFMTSSARYSDVVLPADTNWEREDLIHERGQNFLRYMAGPVTPAGEIKSHEQIAVMLGNKFGIPERDVTQDMTMSERIKKAWDYIKRPITFEEFKKQGIYIDGTLELYQQNSDLRPAGAQIPAGRFGTHTGYFEAYCTNIVAHYVNRGNTNLDSENEPEVLPIPNWIYFEDNYRGIYSSLGVNPADYPFYVMQPHISYRTHSIHDENAFIRELYKKNERGEPAYDAESFGRAEWDSTDVFAGSYGGNGFEPIWMNPDDAAILQLEHGTLVKITSGLTKKAVLASLYITGRTPKGVLQLAQGGWFDPVEFKGEIVDRGACANTLNTDMPSRFDRGPSMMISQVKVEKA